MTTYRPKKSLGQHFLTSTGALDTITHAGHIHPDDVVLEIGPGKGVLTEKLVHMAEKVIAVEKDSNLVAYLTEKFSDDIQKGKLDVLEKDILEFDPNILRFYNHPYKVIANIPYYITGEIVRMFLSGEYKPECMILLVQKEVAERIIAKNGKESILSLSVKFFGTPSYIQTVKRGSFYPVPNVDSAIIKIEIRNTKKEIREEGKVKEKEGEFFKLVKTGFKNKRKKLISNLASVYEKEKLAQAWDKLSLDQNIRAEDVPLDTWLTLTELLN